MTELKTVKVLNMIQKKINEIPSMVYLLKFKK